MGGPIATRRRLFTQTVNHREGRVAEHFGRLADAPSFCYRLFMGRMPYQQMVRALRREKLVHRRIYVEHVL